MYSLIQPRENYVTINGENFFFYDHGPYDPNLYREELGTLLHPYTVSTDTLGRVVL